MCPSNRRQFFQRIGAAGLGALAVSCAKSQTPTFDRPLGAQLYTLRDAIPKDPEGTLKALSEIGFTQVEILHQQVGLIEPYLAKYGLAPVSGHFAAPLVTGDWTYYPKPEGAEPTWDEAVALSSRLGLGCMVIAYLQQGERGTLDFYRRFIDQMNQAGEKSKAAGIQLCYHHHAFEFEPIEGETPFDLLAQGFDPDLVHWQLDIFWLTMGGRNPAEVIRGFSGRVASLHLKDMAKTAKLSFQESEVPPEAFVEIGTGRIDFKETLAAAAESGVRYYLIEQDHVKGDPLDSLAQSYRSLRSLSL